MKNSFSMPAIAWLLLTAVCVFLILLALKISLKRRGWERRRQQKIVFAASVIIAIWIAWLVILSLKGFFADFSKLPPRPALAVIVPLPFILMFAFSKTGTKLLLTVPNHWLVWMQSFRIIVELLLLFAFLGGKLPVQMTFEGRNFDVLTGILALPVGYWLFKRKKGAKRLVIAFNIAGLVLLINVLVIAVLSMPTPLRVFTNEPANTLVAQFPFILLPGVLVPIAYGLHILSLRQMLLGNGPKTGYAAGIVGREQIPARRRELADNI
jgi:hypothetical protein